LTDSRPDVGPELAVGDDRHLMAGLSQPLLDVVGERRALVRAERHLHGANRTATSPRCLTLPGRPV
jgi:hypothetical protein